MENIEPMGIPNNEEHLEALEETIEKLENILGQKRGMMKRHENLSREVEELSVIINGLYKKAESLIEEDKKRTTGQPETEEEWADLFSRTEKIYDLYSRISDLEQEFDVLIAKSEAIQKAFEELE